jgi:flavin reductase ActVB
VAVDESAFKSALSRWGSGVSVITARASDGAPVGLTATSFASLSLQPPLVLFCLGRDSTRFDAFEAADAFAIHLLTAGQEALSSRFAAKGGDKFAGLAVRESRHGLPLLEDCLAVLECRTHARLPGGDHVIVVGEVERLTLGEGEPLLYFRGRYRRIEGAG